MNAITFDEDKSAKISYQNLSKTKEIGDGSGAPPKGCPLQPGELISTIVENITKYSGLEPSVGDIIIREPYCQVDRKKLKEEKPLEYEDYIIRRLVARIDLPLQAFEETKDSMNMSIALSYINTDGIKGIQVGFGENVHVCENRTIFGGFQFSTFGHSKVPFDDGMQLLAHWIQNAVILHDKHIDVIKKLMNVKVHKTGFQRILGSLLEKSVRYNAGERDVIAPLSQTQVGEMVRFGKDVLRDQEKLNGWEILNWGTNTLKAERSDMTHIIEDTAQFNTFLLNEFKIAADFDIA